MTRANARQRSAVSFPRFAHRPPEHTARIKPGPTGPDVFAHWGVLVQTTRFKNNLSQAALGRKFGISGQAFINVESSRRTGSPRLIRWVAETLRIPMARLKFMTAAVNLERVLLEDPGLSDENRRRAIRVVEAAGGFRFYRPLRLPSSLQGSPQSMRALRRLLASGQNRARTRLEGRRA